MHNRLSVIALFAGSPLAGCLTDPGSGPVEALNKPLPDADSGPKMRFTPLSGSLDTTFSDDGMKITDYLGQDDYGKAVTIVGDQIIVGGKTQDPPALADFLVIRYDSDGSRDNGFDGDGIVVLDNPNSASSKDEGKSLVAQGSEIVLAGITSPSLDPNNGRYAVLRLSDVGVQTAFETYNFGGANDEGKAIAYDDPYLYVVGAAKPATSADFDFGLVRFDAAWSTTVPTPVDLGGPNDEANKIVVQDDGKLVVAGVSGSDFGMVRYTTALTVDVSQTWDPGTSDEAFSVAVDPDSDQIVVVGVSDNACARVAYDSTGTQTWSFVEPMVGATADDICTSVAIQDDGRIVVVGSSDGNFLVMRYEDDGTPDTTFDEAHGDHIVTTDFGPDSAAFAVAIQPMGQIVVVGESGSGNAHNVAVARYIP